MTSLVVAFVLFVLLQVGDAITTFLVVSRGYGREANPVMASVIESMGLVNGLVFTKCLLFILAAVVFYMREGEILFWALDVGYVFVVLWNMLIIHRGAPK